MGLPGGGGDIVVHGSAQLTKVKEVGQLKDAGLLTDEEFAAEKAKVLNG